MHEATLRPRSHGDASTPRGVTRRGIASAELKRRRANVLFVLVLTAACAGFLAATTDSKATVYVFALAMLALGGYVYLLVSVNQRETYGRAHLIEQRTAPPSRAAARRGARSDFEDLDEYDGYEEPVRQRATPRQRSVAPAASGRKAPSAPDFPGSGRSGRISYGLGPRGRQTSTRDPYAMPAPRDRYGRDGHGWEVVGRDATRRVPARNGRHATGQQQAVRHPEYSHAG